MFYEKGSVAYEELKPKGSSERSAKSCKCRFSFLSKEVQRFNGMYWTVKRQRKSGTTEKDVVEDAIRLFYKIEEGEALKEFPYLEAWYVLRESPKWRESGEKEAVTVGKKRRISDSQASVTTIDLTTDGSVSLAGTGIDGQGERGRPIGRKSTKRERSSLKMQEKIASELGNAASAIRERSEIVDERLLEHNYLMTINNETNRGRVGAQEYLDLLEREALIVKRRKLKALRMEQEANQSVVPLVASGINDNLEPENTQTGQRSTDNNDSVPGASSKTRLDPPKGEQLNKGEESDNTPYPAS